MIAETAAALFVAHVLADYVLQTRWMVDTKRGAGFAAHIAVVFATAVACLGQLSLAVILITFVHLVIDATKTILMPDRLWSYLADQGLHLASIFAVAALYPTAWQAGLWADMVPSGTLKVLAVAAGLIFAIRAGHFAFVIYLAGPPSTDGKAAAQRAALTGGVERAVVFAAVLGGVAALSLVVLAAKAAIWWAWGVSEGGRWEKTVAGTLASFAFALAVGYATRALVAML